MKRKSLGRFSPVLEDSGATLTGRPDPLPEVFLNHFYVVLDSPTSTAIERDAFLKEHFAANETRTTTNADMTYTGLYFYGVNTYFELFNVADSPGHRVGDCGIAFGVDQPGGVRALQAKLSPSFEPNLKSVTRLYQGKQVPWFFMATAKTLPYEGELSCWVMEYHPEFLANWNPQPKGTNRGISRQKILKRYSEVLKPVDQPRLEDAVALTVAADAPATNNLVHLCLQLGYQIESEPNGEAVTLRGPDFTLLLIRATESVRGVREIRMRTRSVAPYEDKRQLGQSELKFVDRSAIWSFRASE